MPERAWQKLSAGTGAKGHRFYDWAVIDLANPDPGSRQLLILRNRSTGEPGYYRCYSPTPVPLTGLVRIAGSRWRVEEFFQSGRGLAGLHEHQVRRYASWSRRVTLAMLAHAFLAVVRADEHVRHPAPDGLTPLTCNEIQHLFITLVVQPVHTTAYRLCWSIRRRLHRPDPTQATTSDKPPRHEDHDLQLEYWLWGPKPLPLSAEERAVLERWTRRAASGPGAGVQSRGQQRRHPRRYDQPQRGRPDVAKAEQERDHAYRCRQYPPSTLASARAGSRPTLRNLNERAWGLDLS